MWMRTRLSEADRPPPSACQGPDLCCLLSRAGCLPVVVPFLGFWLRARSGSWLPQLVLAAIAKIVTGTLYMRWAGATAVRTQLLEEKRAAAKAAAAFK
jgi:hypothetical protein